MRELHWCSSWSVLGSSVFGCDSTLGICKLIWNMALSLWRVRTSLFIVFLATEYNKEPLLSKLSKEFSCV